MAKQCSDGLATADLPETDAAFDVADRECLTLTAGEYGFLAVLGQALECHETGREPDKLQMAAFVHAARVVEALMNDVNL